MDVMGKMRKQVTDQHPFAHTAGSSILKAQVGHSYCLQDFPLVHKAVYARNHPRPYRCSLLFVSIKAQGDREWGAPVPSTTCGGSSFAFPALWHVPVLRSLG